MSRAARELLIARIIAGDTNYQIRELFESKRSRWFPGNLSDQTFAVYRRMPEVAEARQLVAQEAKQTGIADFGRRVTTLMDLSTKLMNRITGTEAAELSTSELVQLHKEIRETMKQVAEDVDRHAPADVSLITNEEKPTDVEASVTVGISSGAALGLLADVLREVNVKVTVGSRTGGSGPHPTTVTDDGGPGSTEGDPADLEGEGVDLA